jgi:hypothetical protein
MSIRFEWDAAKAAANLRKHGISFDIASLAFAEPFALMAQDRIDGGEYRWQTLGLVERRLLVLVAHTFRDEDGVEIVRIISARKATRKERQRYDHENR